MSHSYYISHKRRVYHAQTLMFINSLRVVFALSFSITSCNSDDDEAGCSSPINYTIFKQEFTEASNTTHSLSLLMESKTDFETYRDALLMFISEEEYNQLSNTDLTGKVALFYYNRSGSLNKITDFSINICGERDDFYDIQIAETECNFIEEKQPATLCIIIMDDPTPEKVINTYLYIKHDECQ